jgi:hypothetical protein
VFIENTALLVCEFETDLNCTFPGAGRVQYKNKTHKKLEGNQYIIEKETKRHKRLEPNYNNWQKSAKKHTKISTKSAKKEPKEGQK